MVKTALMRHIAKDISLRKLEINADQFKYIEMLSSRDLSKDRVLNKCPNLATLFFYQTRRDEGA